MARKYDLISELYNRTCKTVVSNPQNWQAFLASACRNYKLRYDEQLLLYAQRPDATAVLEIEQWNKIFGRWVNRGARGIAVFADENRSRQRLTHYFDISDTHESRYSRTVPIWDMRQEYEADVIETLESTFGEIENKSSLAEAIMGAARNAAEDNIPDYLQDLYYATEGSSFEEVEEDIVAFIYKNVVTNSVAYMMMSRLGVDTDGYFELDDFRDVTNFNTQETLNALGFATSDIAEMGLTEISKTITALNRQNRIIAGQDRNEYNKVENNDERSLDNERTDLHDGGRLQPSEPKTSTAAGSDVGQIRSDEERVSEGTSQSPLLQSPDEGRTDTALGGSGTKSQQDGGNNPEPDGTERGSDRTDESRGYDEMGSSDELPSQLGTGSRESGSDIRLEYYDRTHEDKSLPFFGRDEVINEILRTTPHLSASLEEIKDYYERNPDNKDRTEYIKSIFNNDYTELTLEDGRTVGYKTFENVLHLWEGKYDSRTAQSFYDWAVIARHFEAMRLLGELSDSIKPLPSMDGQMTFILDGRAEEKKTSAFTFSQEIIDAVLANGSGFSEGKMRIYEQFEKSLSAKENADFLKNEYGWGGSYPHTDIKENIIYFKDFVSGRKNTYDDNSHGTHICGIIGGRGIVNKKYKGIAPHCYLLPIKVLDKSGHGRSESIINASDWIIRNKNKYNIRIVNISIGTKSSSCSEEKSDIVKAVDNMWDNGITVLVSAGNNGPSYQSITIPGISRKVITVGSCKFDNSSYDGHFKYSGKGPTFCNVAKPDILASSGGITIISSGRITTSTFSKLSNPLSTQSKI